MGSLMWDSILGSCPEPQADAQPLSHPGIPCKMFVTSDVHIDGGKLTTPHEIFSSQISNFLSLMRRYCTVIIILVSLSFGVVDNEVSPCDPVQVP